MTKLFRFYIGYTDREGKRVPFERMEIVVKQAVGRYFPNAGYTNYNACGVWQGASEDTLVVEVIVETSEWQHGLQHQKQVVAAHFAKVLNQSCVLVTEQEISAEFIQPDGTELT